MPRAVLLVVFCDVVGHKPSSFHMVDLSLTETSDNADVRVHTGQGECQSGLMPLAQLGWGAVI